MTVVAELRFRVAPNRTAGARVYAGDVWTGLPGAAVHTWPVWTGAAGSLRPYTGCLDGRGREPPSMHVMFGRWRAAAGVRTRPDCGCFGAEKGTQCAHGWPGGWLERDSGVPELERVARRRGDRGAELASGMAHHPRVVRARRVSNLARPNTDSWASRRGGARARVLQYAR